MDDVAKVTQRKIFELMALSINSCREIAQIYADKEIINIPYANWQSPDLTRAFSFNLDIMKKPDEYRYLLCIDISGNGIIEFDGVKEQAIDAGHKYTIFNKDVKTVKINIGTRELFGDNQWNIKINSIKLMIVDYKFFKSTYNILQIFQSLNTFNRNEKNRMMKYLHDELFNLYDSPNIIQLFGINSIFGNKSSDPSMYNFLSDVYADPIFKGNVNDIEKRNINYEKYYDVFNIIFKKFKDLKNEENSKIYAFGHCHIDAAWLWPYSETERKVERSFLNALKLYDTGYKMYFAQSSALYYSWIEKNNPDMFSRIKELVNSGLWIPAGGMWVESDTNLIRGESLARQLLYGQKYFYEKFGKYARIGWLPDSFGFSGQLPQLFIKSGLKVFVTHKPEWNENTEFPEHCFNWKGIDQTSIIANIVNSTYNGNINFDSIIDSWHKFKNKNAPMTYLYGYGDGGGGPNIQMMYNIELAKEYKYIPNIESESSESNYLKNLSDIKDQIPEYKGEIYLETHRGVYTTNFTIKSLVATAEDNLHILEFINSMNYLSGNYISPDRIRELWIPVLKAEFHDILPGSADHDAYNEAFKELKDDINNINSEVNKSINEFARNNSIKKGLLAINSSNYDFDRFMHLPYNLNYDNLKIIKAGNSNFIYLKVPHTGYSTVTNDYNFDDVGVIKRNGAYEMSNGRIKAIIHKDGTVSVFGKDGETVIKKGNMVNIYNDIPVNFDAWNIDYSTLNLKNSMPCIKTEISFINKEIIGMIEINRTFEDNSTVSQTVTLMPGAEFLEFENNISMKNREKFVKVLFDPDFDVDHITREIPFGNIQTRFDAITKKTHFEFPALRYINCTEGNRNIVLFSRESHGYSYISKQLGISIGKFPLYPDPYSDIDGYKEKFYLAINIDDSEVSKLSEFLFNSVKLSYLDSSYGENETESLLNFKGADLKLENIKISEKNAGIIARFYNNSDKRSKLELNLPDNFTINETDIIEDEIKPFKAELDFNAFEIKSLLIIKE